MTFNETVNKLYEETNQTTVFGIRAFTINGKNDIGFRRECARSSLKNPVIDGVPFMICADAYDDILSMRITTIEDLLCTPNDQITVCLRGIAGPPMITVDLGYYRVDRMMKVDDDMVRVCITREG